MPHDFQPILDYAFTIGIELTGARWIKPTSIGMTRAAVYAGSGTIQGPMLRGKVIPMSGGDFPLVRDEYYMRVSPKFGAPDGPHAWLNRHVFVGVAEKIPGTTRIHYFVVR